MRVGLISDTHVPTQVARLPADAIEALAGCEAILHAGDLVDVCVLDVLGRIAPVYAVRGNMDGGAAADLPRRRVVELGGVRIGLTHGAGGGGDIEERVFRELVGEGVDVMVFGHTHRPVVRTVGGMLMVNPGSPAGGRDGSGRSVAILTLDGTVSAEVVPLEGTG